MSHPRDRRRRTAVGYWVPLALTVTALSIGLAAWIWSERREDDDDDGNIHPDSSHQSPSRHKSKSLENDSPSYGGPESSQDSQRHGTTQPPLPDTLYARVTDVISRTPSPQHLVGEAGRRIGAAFGLGSSRSTDFRDHQRWQEEAEMRAAAALVADSNGDEGKSEEEEVLRVEEQEKGTRHDAEAAMRRMGAVGEVVGTSGRVEAQTTSGAQTRAEAQTQSGLAAKTKTGKKRTMAVVVSAKVEWRQEEASGMRVLRSLAAHAVDTTATDLIILIYAPHLQAYPANLLSSQSTPQTPPRTAYDKVQNLALSLVPHPAHILPFTKPMSYIHLLRHLAPSIVYLQDELAGSEGEHVAQVKGWVRQMVLVCSEEERLQDLTLRSKGVDVVLVGRSFEQHWINAIT